MASESDISPNTRISEERVHVDLEVKDPHLIFSSVWSQLEEEKGREAMRFPRELILLGGAPGAGKGTNTPFIMGVRGLTCEPIVVSSLLDSPEAKRIKDAGGMVGDRQVVEILFRKMLEPEYRNGVILDGFPRRASLRSAQKMRLEPNLPAPSGQLFRHLLNRCNVVVQIAIRSTMFRDTCCDRRS